MKDGKCRLFEDTSLCTSDCCGCSYRLNTGITVSELLERFPKKFWVNINTETIIATGYVDNINDEDLLGKIIHYWKVEDSNNVLVINC